MGCLICLLLFPLVVLGELLKTTKKRKRWK